jgi:hypothetical protein
MWIVQRRFVHIRHAAVCAWRKSGSFLRGPLSKFKTLSMLLCYETMMEIEYTIKYFDSRFMLIDARHVIYITSQRRLIEAGLCARPGSLDSLAENENGSVQASRLQQC